MTTFTQQEKESLLTKWGFIIDTVIGYDNRQEGVVDIPVKVALDRNWDREYILVSTKDLTGKYYINIQTNHGIDTVFEREFKKKLMEVLT